MTGFCLRFASEVRQGCSLFTLQKNFDLLASTTTASPATSQRRHRAIHLIIALFKAPITEEIAAAWCPCHSRVRIPSSVAAGGSLA